MDLAEEKFPTDDGGLIHKFLGGFTSDPKNTVRVVHRLVSEGWGYTPTTILTTTNSTLESRYNSLQLSTRLATSSRSCVVRFGIAKRRKKVCPPSTNGGRMNHSMRASFTSSFFAIYLLTTFPLKPIMSEGVSESLPVSGVK